MNLHEPVRKLTYEDYVLIPEDGKRHEIIGGERASIITEKNIQGAPDLVIEILSKDTRRLDEVIKREAYERFGVREYWIFDRYRKAAKVLGWRTGGRRREVLLSAAAGDVLTTPLLPGLEVPLAEIFEE